IACVIGQIKKRIDLCDGHSLLRRSNLHDLVTSSHFAFLQDAEVEPGATTGRQQCGHPRFIHANADAIASNARLRDLEKCSANLIAVADAHGLVGQTFDREVLTELSVDEVSPPQLLLPIAVGFDLIHEDGSRLAAVSGQVTLAISLE